MLSIKDLAEEDGNNANLHTKLSALVNLIARRFIEKDISTDGLSLRLKYKDTNYLCSLNSKQFIKERNKLLLEFICGAINIEFEQQSSPSFLYAIAVTIEMVYFLKNLNLVLPHCFMINLLQSFTSGLKTVTNMNWKCAPGASYTTYKTWLNEQGKDSLACPEGDVVTFFDNMGKYVIKHYKISSKIKQKQQKLQQQHCISHHPVIYKTKRNLYHRNGEIKVVFWTSKLKWAISEATHLKTSEFIAFVL